MTDEGTALLELMEKGADADLVRDMLAFVAERIKEAEVETAVASTNPLGRINKDINRRADVVGIFPNDEAAVRLVGALMLETNDEWAVARRYMSPEALARVIHTDAVGLPAVVA